MFAFGQIVCYIHVLRTLSNYLQPITGPVMRSRLRTNFNSSLTNGAFPDIWNIARTTPSFKSGAKDDVNNYRPISVI